MQTTFTVKPRPSKAREGRSKPAWFHSFLKLKPKSNKRPPLPPLPPLLRSCRSLLQCFLKRAWTKAQESSATRLWSNSWKPCGPPMHRLRVTKPLKPLIYLIFPWSTRTPASWPANLCTWTAPALRALFTMVRCVSKPVIFPLTRRLRHSPVIEGEIFSGLLQKLNEQFAGVGVSFTTERPESGDHSTVYLGGDGSAFRDYGIFYGVAERVDVGNTDRSDRAFVFTDNLAGVSNSLSGYVDLLAGFVAHETGRLLGYANELTPTLELLESHPLLAVAAAPLPETLVNLSQPLDEPSPGAPSAAATQNDGTTGVSGEYDEEMIGEHIDFTITFDNIGTSEGYAPYIDFTAESGITFARQVNEFTGEVTIADSAAVLLGEEIGSDIQVLGKIVEVAVLVDEVQAAADAWLAARVADPIVAAYLLDHSIVPPVSYDFVARTFDTGNPANVENFLFNSNLSAAYQALVNLRDNGEVTNSSPVLGSIPDDSIDNTGDTVGADDPDLIPNQVQYFNQTTSDFLTPEGAPAGAVAKFWVPPTFTVPSTNFHNLNLSSFVTLRLDHPLTGASLSADGTAAPGSALTAGLSHGDIYYTMELPFGSYTPGQPEALIDFEARLAPEDGAAVFHNQDNATDDRADYELSVRALGGFRLGADPNDNPDEDPLVAGNPSADSVVPQVVELVKDGPETVIQQGPSYPNIYSLFVDVAAGETLEDLLIEDFLPGTVVYVPNSITVQYRTGSEAGILRVNQPGSDNIYSDIVAGTSTAITGSVAVTQGSAAVVGTGTSFTSALAVDDLLTIGAQTFTVNAIADDTNLTLSSNYLGISGAGLSGFVSPGGYSESLLEDFLTNDTPNGPGGTLELYWQSFTAVDNINADGDYDSSLENDFNWNFGDGLTGGEFTGSNATGQNHPRIEERLRNRDWDIYITYEAYAPEFDALGIPTGGQEADNDAVLTAVHNGNAVADNDNFENGHDDERLDSDWSDIVVAPIGTGKAITNTFDSNGNPVERGEFGDQVVPGDIIEFTLSMGMSDFSALDNIVMEDFLSDGLIYFENGALLVGGDPIEGISTFQPYIALRAQGIGDDPVYLGTYDPDTGAPTAYVPLGSPVVVEDIVWDTVDNRWEDGAGNPIDNIGGYTAALDPDASPATGTSSGADYLTWALSRELAPGRTGVFVNGLAGGERLVNGQDETFYDAGTGEGTFNGGTGGAYLVDEVLTLLDGSTVTIDAVGGGGGHRVHDQFLHLHRCSGGRSAHLQRWFGHRLRGDPGYRQLHPGQRPQRGRYSRHPDRRRWRYDLRRPRPGWRRRDRPLPLLSRRPL